MAIASDVDTAADGRVRESGAASSERLVHARSSGGDTGFFAWAVGSYLFVTGALWAVGLRRTHGTFVYVIDDPAIHLSVAQNLIRHATWGVTPHHFQSASSSPAWTALLAVTLGVLPFFRDYLPLALNIGAGIWLLRILDRNQNLLRPSLRRPLHVLGTLMMVTFVLFLPGLAMTGMEHTLHAALMLAVVVMFHRRSNGEPLRWPRWVPFALLGVATLTRFESPMVALGVGIALLAPCYSRWSPDGRAVAWRSRLPVVVAVGAASGLPLLAFAVLNKAMGQGVLPNSVLAKSQFGGVDFVKPFGFENVAGKFVSDPLIPLLTFVALGYLLFCRPGRNRSVFPAVVTVVATTLHMTFSNVGWFERYQIYLIILATYTALAIVAELAEHQPAGTAKTVRTGVAVIMSLAVVLAPVKWGLFHRAPLAMADTYRQRYQAARFLERYYDGQAIATGELGYISLHHKGPITDLLGLGDYAVLRNRQTGRYRKADFARLARERGFKVVAVYPTTLEFHVPDNWIAVGTWTLMGRTSTAYTPTFWFLATTPDAVRPLEAHLREYARSLPKGVSWDINGLAEYRADVLSGKRPKLPGDQATCGRPDCSARPGG